MEYTYSVSEFLEFTNLYLEGINEVVVCGEISSIKLSQNKWFFITVKDEQCSMEVFAISAQNPICKQLTEGMLINIYGRPRLYQKTGRFSLFARLIVPAGEGLLKVTFEKLKAKLENEGLFDQQRKRELVPFPQKIGLITAKDSQAYKDFVKVLQERLGGIKIYYYPASVQGKDSIASIQQAFHYFNASGLELDAIALIRGGGSLEDLYSFNTEEVVKAIFSSKYPVICGVGHEGDITLADLVADVRASTPSNAAELICFGSDHAMAEVKHFEYKIATCMHTKTDKYVSQLASFSHATQRFAYVRIGIYKNLLAQFDKACENIQTNAKLKMLKADQSIEKALYSVSSKLKLAQAKTTANTKLLEALDYKRLLTKGYAIVYTADGKILHNAKDVNVGQSIKTQLANGVLISNIERSDYD